MEGLYEDIEGVGEIPVEIGHKTAQQNDSILRRHLDVDTQVQVLPRLVHERVGALLGVLAQGLAQGERHQAIIYLDLGRLVLEVFVGVAAHLVLFHEAQEFKAVFPVCLV